MPAGESSHAPSRSGAGASRNKAGNEAIDMVAVNAILREYVQVTKVIPNDMDELVRSGFVRRLPSPPAGKKFVIVRHPLGYTVELGDR